MSNNRYKKISAKKAEEQKARREAMYENLYAASGTDADRLLVQLGTTPQGLTEDEADESRDAFGANRVTHQRKNPLPKRIARAFMSPFTAILLLLALVSAVTDIYMPIRAGMPEEADFITVVIILSMVAVSGVLQFVQETRSGNAAAKLLEMITTTTNVERRGAGPRELPLEEVVVGDIVRLAAGDMVPADVRVLAAKDLFISQAALTGESEPLEKLPDAPPARPDTPMDCQNLAFMGSNVISGSATVVAVAVGDDTVFGSMAESVAADPAPTSFEKGVTSVSWVLIRFMAVMVPVVFVLNGITKGNWLAAFLFAVSIAVGLTPEMLPMIVTTCLAKGAVSMSQKKTIIKSLNSIQSFGAMDILCTDKTGTLTQDKVVLQYHMDVHGNEDTRVLRHAFLNSHYQMGLKNLMDLAIIRRTREEEGDPALQGLADAYRKVDEIPFDFTRRRMSVVVEDKTGKTQMITKGAVEEMLGICSHVEYQGRVEPITEELRRDILVTVDDLNDDGMRVIAVAQKTEPSPVGAFGVKDEADMVLIGYLAFLDPPKATTAKAIKTLAEYGVTTKILTGDNDKVTRCICRQVGLPVDRLLLGADVEAMTDEELKQAAEETSVFAKLSPDQKARVVRLLRENGHTVGYMGDGINDAAAMQASDIGISVDTAVDIAKESADIILLEKDLMVLEEGIVEGRKTYANMIKYIKMTASSNFGNTFSVLVASAFLPFLPMMSIHLLLLNLIYDIACIAIPWDNVDEEYLRVPRTWDASSVGSFMLWLGPVSSVFDITTYLVLYFILCPMFASGGVLYGAIPRDDTAARALYVAMFQAGWFVESMWTQTLVIHMIRTPKIPFLQSRASAQVSLLTCAGIALLSAIPYTDFGRMLELAALPWAFWPFLLLTVILYMALITTIKKAYVRRYGELL